MLSRSLTPLHATALVVGIIIGASIFVQPSVITGTVPGVGAVYGVWIVSGVLTLCGALIAAELASAYPHAGGVYVFLREAFSPAVGFLWGWAMFWTMHTGIIAVIAMVFARYAAFFVPVGDAGQRAIAVIAIAVLTAVNYVGVRQGSLVQTTLTVLKVGAVAAIIAGVFGLGARVPVPATLGVGDSGQPFTVSNFLLGVVAGLFAFGGWHMVTYAAEEIREPERTIPRALVVGVLVVTASYIALNAAYFHVLSPWTIAHSNRVAADAADAVLGRGGAAAMSAIVVVSTFGALNGVVLAGPRAYLAMARDRLLVRGRRRFTRGITRRIARCCSRGSGRRARVDGDVSQPVHARRVHGVDLLRADGGGAAAAAAAAGVHARLSRVGLSRRPPRVHRVLGVHRGEPDHRRSAGERDGLLFVLAGLPVYFLLLRRPHQSHFPDATTQHADRRPQSLLSTGVSRRPEVG